MMKNIVQLIRERKFTEAEDQIDDAIPLIMEKKLFEMKKAVAAKMCEQMGIKTASEKIRGELTEDEKEESPKQTLSKRADNYDRTEVPKATNALATLQTDYGRNSSIGKKAQTAYDSVIAKRDQLEKNAHDARVAQDKDDESSRVKNKLSDYAKGGYLTKDAAEKYIYSAKSNIQGGEYAKRRVSQSEPINEEELDEQERPDVILGNKAWSARYDADHADQYSNIDNLKNNANKAEQDYNDATKSHRKDVESQRVTNKLSSIAKENPNLRPEMEKLNWKSKADKYGGEYAKRHTSQTEPLKEEEGQLDEARINIVRARVRGGKVQRRKKVSNVAGMTLRGGTLKRMSAAERRRRKMGARRGKVKRRAKLSRSLMKRKRSLQKRKSLGL